MRTRSCDLCGKEFKRSGDLKRHLNRKNKCNTVYSCDICKKVFNNRSSLNKHKKRKTSCEPIISKNFNVPEPSKNKCIYCNRAFVRKSSLSRHHRVCKVKNGNMELLYRKVLEQQAQIEMFKRMLEDRDLVMRRPPQPQSQVNNMNTTNNVVDNSTVVNNTMNNYFNLNINDFGSSRGGYTIDELIEMSKKHRGINLIPAMVKDIHFNDKRPQDHNIYFPNTKKPDQFLVYEKQWAVITLLHLVDELYNKCKEEIVDITLKSVEEGNDSPDVEKLKKLCMTLQDIIKDDFNYQDIGLSIKKTVKNGRAIVKYTWDSMSRPIRLGITQT